MSTVRSHVLADLKMYRDVPTPRKRRETFERKPPQKAVVSREPAKGQRMAYALLDEVCERRGVVRYDVMRKCNERRVVDARNEVAYLLRQADPLLWTYPKIGRFLGGKHHTTIIHGVRQHELKKAA